tara:strand:+ start:355 stop:579 length:225 start_codon:yes stop_codon:yes gene_type:complete
MATTIIEKDGRPVQLYQNNTWESGACDACADVGISESAGWVNPGMLGSGAYPAIGWATLGFGLLLGYFLFRGGK